MVRWPTSCRRLRPLKAHLSQIERIDKDIDHPNGIVLANPVLQAFRKQRALRPIRALNEAPHPSPPQIAWASYLENHFKQRVFTHGVIPGQSHTEALGISSPGIDEAHLLGLAMIGELQWSIMSDWTYR